MSIIYKRGKHWYYSAMKNGKRWTRSLKVEDKASANALKRDLDIQYARNVFHLREIKSQKILPFIDEYNRIMQKLIQTSWGKRLGVLIMNFRRFSEGRSEVWLEDITMKTIYEYMAFRLAEYVSGKTVSEEVRTVRRMLEYAVSSNYLREVTIDWKKFNLSGMARTRNHYPPYAEWEIEKIWNSGLKDVPFFKVCYYTGLRGSDAGRLAQHNLDRRQGIIFMRTKKTGEPVELWVHPNIQFIFDIKTEYLFPEYREEWQRNHAMERLKKFNAENGINKRCNIHSFRHSFNQRLLELGLEYGDRAKLMGHRSATMTQDYTHFDLELQKRYLAKIK